MAGVRLGGLRGSALEDAINRTAEAYLLRHLALVQKIPTPIVPSRLDPNTGVITEAFFEQKSTVDYIGVVQGIPVCFDAKECAGDSFPLKNVQDHQIRFMEDWEQQDGIAFLLIRYTKKDLDYYLRFPKLREFLARMEQGGRKSIAFSELEEDFFLKPRAAFLIPFLDGLKRDLALREDEE